MTIERDAFRNIIYECDACPEAIETDEEDWNPALTRMKEAGWASRKMVDEWMHFCPICKAKRASE